MYRTVLAERLRRDPQTFAREIARLPVESQAALICEAVENSLPGPESEADYFAGAVQLAGLFLASGEVNPPYQEITLEEGAVPHVVHDNNAARLLAELTPADFTSNNEDGYFQLGRMIGEAARSAEYDPEVSVYFVCQYVELTFARESNSNRDWLQRFLLGFAEGRRFSEREISQFASNILKITLFIWRFPDQISDKLAELLHDSTADVWRSKTPPFAERLYGNDG
ncbi:MAG: hypothetical protein ABH823_00560 [bacterium]